MMYYVLGQTLKKKKKKKLVRGGSQGTKFGGAKIVFIFFMTRCFTNFVLYIKPIDSYQIVF